MKNRNGESTRRIRITDTRSRSDASEAARLSVEDVCRTTESLTVYFVFADTGWVSFTALDLFTNRLDLMIPQDRISVNTRACVCVCESVALFRVVWISAVVQCVDKLYRWIYRCVTCLFLLFVFVSSLREPRPCESLPCSASNSLVFSCSSKNPRISQWFLVLSVACERVLCESSSSASVCEVTHSNCSWTRFFRGFVFDSLLFVWFTLKNKGSTKNL